MMAAAVVAVLMLLSSLLLATFHFTAIQFAAVSFAAINQVVITGVLPATGAVAAVVPSVGATSFEVTHLADEWPLPLLLFCCSYHHCCCTPFHFSAVIVSFAVINPMAVAAGSCQQIMLFLSAAVLFVC
jgi:hypothetical protein